MGVFVGFFILIAVLPGDLLSSLSKPSTPTVNNTQNIPAVDLLTLEKIATHNTASDCYLVVNSSVYNVTPFIDKHPGGRERIIAMCGQQATEIFSRIHSNFAWNLLKSFYVGDVAVVK